MLVDPKKYVFSNCKIGFQIPWSGSALIRRIVFRIRIETNADSQHFFKFSGREPLYSISVSTGTD